MKRTLQEINLHAYNYMQKLMRMGIARKEAYSKLTKSPIWNEGRDQLWLMKFGDRFSIYCKYCGLNITATTAHLHHIQYNELEYFTLEGTEFICRVCHNRKHENIDHISPPIPIRPTLPRYIPIPLKRRKRRRRFWK